MKSILKQKADELVSLYKEISKSYKWENELQRYFIAFTYLQNNRPFIKEELEDINQYIKSKTKLFSGYSDYQSSKLILASSLINKFENPKEAFDELLINDDKLNKIGFKSSAYLPLANYSLLTSSSDNQIEDNMKKAYEAYEHMKKSHPFLTGQDDYPLCMLIATSSTDINEKIDKIEKYYAALNEVGFNKGNSLQLLSQILSFSDDEIIEKSRQCKEILNTLKANKLNLSSSYYSSLGMLTLIYHAELMEEVIELANYMIKLKEFKWLGKENNIAMAISIVVNYHKDENQLLHATLSSCIEQIIQAQQVATMVIVMSAVSASTSTN